MFICLKIIFKLLKFHNTRYERSRPLNSNNYYLKSEQQGRICIYPFRDPNVLIPHLAVNSKGETAVKQNRVYLVERCSNEIKQRGPQSCSGRQTDMKFAAVHA